MYKKRIKIFVFLTALWAWEKRVKTCWILAAVIFWYSLHQPLNLQNCCSICNHLPFFQYEIILHFRLFKWQCLFEDPIEDSVSSGNCSSVGSEGEESLSKEHLSIAGPCLNWIFPYGSASAPCVSSLLILLHQVFVERESRSHKTVY